MSTALLPRQVLERFIEISADRNTKQPNQKDQRVQKADSVQLDALWVQHRNVEQLRPNTIIFHDCDPKLEANPFSEDHIRRLNDEDRWAKEGYHTDDDSSGQA